jgi:hypothetical protein
MPCKKPLDHRASCKIDLWVLCETGLRLCEWRVFSLGLPLAVRLSAFQAAVRFERDQTERVLVLLTTCARFLSATVAESSP